MPIFDDSTTRWYYTEEGEGWRCSGCGAFRKLPRDLPGGLDPHPIADCLENLCRRVDAIAQQVSKR